MSRLKRRTHWRKLVGWRELGIRLFPHSVDEAKILAETRSKVEKEMKSQANEQKIEKIRNERVKEALRELKQKGEIKYFRQTEKLGYGDLIKGVDFWFRYVDGRYEKFCSFSVTSKDWVQKRLQKHSEIPVLAIGLQERQESIEAKILALKDAELKKEKR